MLRQFFRTPVAIAAALFVVILARASSGASPHVDCDAGDSLQQAIDAAPSGATLHVSGVCVGDFEIDRDMTLDGVRNATLQGGGATVVTIAEDVNATLRDLTITGGLANAALPDELRANAIFNSGDLTLDGKTTIANNAGYMCDPPTAIPCTPGYPFFVDHVAVVNVGTLTIGGQAVIRENVGAIRNAGLLTLEDRAAIEDNVAVIWGGGVRNEGTFRMYDQSVIQRNHASNSRVGSGGGIYNEGVLEMHDRSTVRENRAAQVGDGIANHSGDISLKDRATIEDNVGTGVFSYGGTITLNDRYQITGNTFHGIYLSDSGGTVINGSLAGVSGNTPSDCFGCP